MYKYILIILLILSGVVHSEIINVPDDFEAIQTAIDESEDGDTVLVQPGVYEENLAINSSLTLGSLTLTTGVQTYVDSTFIDGRQRGSVITISGNEDASVQISGFTIRNGEARDGGGIYCNQASPIISDCIIEANHARFYGGGMSYHESDPTITRCIIRNNEARSCGGAFYFIGSNPVINHCVILCNRSSHTSVFEALNNSIITFLNCTISRNSGDGDWCYIGGDVICDFNNCIIWDNSQDVAAILGGDVPYQLLSQIMKGEGTTLKNIMMLSSTGARATSMKIRFLSIPIVVIFI
ncbi:MAG: hypothetical protein HQ568_04745 [Calditrichaeota bacterium]|nr:hypothetical protein [Calditrichota bacterium]